ncbi:MAG: 3-deoxy-7-phosphoheptulonate synthase, partial [Pseudomonadota bacterium]|nr:3-deoxy-7-phosphoheptulonate synthase [Pseudomonadota bacterium]
MTATLVHPDGWYPTSWRRYPARQMPAYADPEALRAVEARLASAAPVVPTIEAANLRGAMARLASGDGFLLQGGDCAESFDDPVAEQVAGIVGLFDAMSARLAPVARGPLIEVARIAGQFAKPRSADAETQSDETLPAYRGDIVNGSAFDPASRKA